jgi:hypothetical protein
MVKTNRNWLPAYCRPDWFTPKIQETRVLEKLIGSSSTEHILQQFSYRPGYFREFDERD